MGRDRDRLLRYDRVGYGRTPREGHARRRREMRPLLESPARGGIERETPPPLPALCGRGGVGAGVQGGMKGRIRLGVIMALVVLVADQASKWWVLNVLDLPTLRQVVLLPVLNLTMV